MSDYDAMEPILSLLLIIVASVVIAGLAVLIKFGSDLTEFEE